VLRDSGIRTRLSRNSKQSGWPRGNSAILCWKQSISSTSARELAKRPLRSGRGALAGGGDLARSIQARRQLQIALGTSVADYNLGDFDNA